MNNFYQTQTSKSFKIFFLFCVAILVFAIPYAYMYNQEGSETVTIYSVNEQQHISGNNEDGFSTTYYYYVSTDKGMYRIDTDGIFHSDAFGSLNPGETYYIKTRGVRAPFFGIYPFIMSAQKV